MQISTRSRRLTVAGACAALALTLSACGGGTPTAEPTPVDTATSAPTGEATPSATPSDTPTPITPSTTLDRITVAGEYGSAPQVTVPAPFAIDETRTKTLKQGTGDVRAEPDSIVEVNYVGVNARTGEPFDSSWERGKNALFSLQQVVPGFTKGLTGARPGQRLLVAMPGPDGYDSSGGSPEAGIQVGDTLVFVIDVIAISQKEAGGEVRTPRLPFTVGDEDGKPQVTIPAGTPPPTTPLVADLIVGTQRPVAPEDYVLVKYRAWSWTTGQVIQDTFDQPDAGQLSDTIPAWKAGLAGKRIGSRVVLTAPASEEYPEGTRDAPVQPDDTVVYLVDILFSSGVA